MRQDSSSNISSSGKITPVARGSFADCLKRDENIIAHSDGESCGIDGTEFHTPHDATTMATTASEPSLYSSLGISTSQLSADTTMSQGFKWSQTESEAKEESGVNPNVSTQRDSRPSSKTLPFGQTASTIAREGESSKANILPGLEQKDERSSVVLSNNSYNMTSGEPPEKTDCWSWINVRIVTIAAVVGCIGTICGIVLPSLAVANIFPKAPEKNKLFNETCTDHDQCKSRDCRKWSKEDETKFCICNKDEHCGVVGMTCVEEKCIDVTDNPSMRPSTRPPTNMPTARPSAWPTVSAQPSSEKESFFSAIYEVDLGTNASISPKDEKLYTKCTFDEEGPLACTDICQVTKAISTPAGHDEFASEIAYPS